MVLWPTVAKQAGRWYRGVVKAADGLMARWHTVEVDKSWLPHAHEDAKKGEKEKGGARGGGRSRTDTADDECRKGRANRVARHQCDKHMEPALSICCLPIRIRFRERFSYVVVQPVFGSCGLRFSLGGRQRQH